MGRKEEEMILGDGEQRRTVHNKKLLKSPRAFEFPWVAASVGATVRDLGVYLSMHHTWSDMAVGDLDDEIHSESFISLAR
jgi:hypothetical protein